MLITCFQHSDFETPGCLIEWARQRDYDWRTVSLHEGEPVPDASKYTDWVVILGGPMGVREEKRYPWLREEKAYIRLSIRAGRTVLGICLGAQLIADVLGAFVTRNDHAELGWMVVNTTLEARGRFPLVPERLQALCWHNDTFDIPPGALPFGSSEACRNQGFFVGDRVLGLQFHLEWYPHDIKRLVDNSAEDFAVRGRYVQSPVEIIAGVQWAQRANTLMNGILDALPV
ncbi:MAG: type 1 glutamine amidotransferase [Deltaproteobacteria bacterium]|nr:type 1 glutamine amidotransferase [Deltaproteobacteria bacterium]